MPPRRRDERLFLEGAFHGLPLTRHRCVISLLVVVGCTTTESINTMEVRLSLPTPNLNVVTTEVALELASGFESRWASDVDAGSVTTTDGFAATTRIADTDSNGRREFVVTVSNNNPFSARTNWSLFLNRNPDGTKFAVKAKVTLASQEILTGAATDVEFRREGTSVDVALTCVDGGAACTTDGGVDAGDAGIDAGSVPTVDVSRMRIVHNSAFSTDQIEGLDGSATPGSVVEVYRNDDGGAFLVGLTAGSAGGIVGSAGDTGLLSVAVRARVDASVSAFGTVTQQRVEAHFLNKDAGPTSNPNIARFLASTGIREGLSVYLADGGSTEFATAQYANIAASDGLSTETDSGIASTAHTATKAAIDARGSLVAVYRPISTSQLVYIFGGNLSSDVWTWSGSGYSKLATSSGPAARQFTAAAYDKANTKIWVFGGSSPPPGITTTFDDIWELNLDGGVNFWTNRTPAGDAGTTRPAARTGHSMVYDERNLRVVMFGGTADDRTWEWNPTAFTWTYFDAGAGSPSKRQQAQMVFYGSSSNTNSTVLLYGGVNGATKYSDIYVWDGAGKIWRVGAPTSFADAGRYGGAFARKETDANGSPFLLYGGLDKNGNWPTDVWEVAFTPASATAWTRRAPSGLGYGREQIAWIMSDATSGKYLLFGGFSSDGTVLGLPAPIPPVGDLGDTWLYDPGAFTFTEQTALNTAAIPVAYPAFAYDSSSDRLIAMGGTSISVNVSNANDSAFPRGETLSFTDKWSRVAFTGPAKRHGAAMVGDPASSGNPILFGGYTVSNPTIQNDMWKFSSSTWIAVNPATSPPARWGAAIMADSDRRRVLLFGGCTGTAPTADTWEWDGNNWTQLSIAGPSARSFASLSYDSVRKKGVLYGGDLGQDAGFADCNSNGVSASAETWEFDGTVPSWTLASVAAPVGRATHAGSFDSVRGRVQVYGGTTDAGLSADFMEYDGVAWSQLSVANLLPREKHGMAYFSSQGAVYAFAGISNDLWRIGMVGRYAQQLFQFNVGAMGAATPWSAIRVQYAGAGAGSRGSAISTTETAVAGVYVSIWNNTNTRWDLLTDTTGAASLDTTVSAANTAQYVSSGNVYILATARYPASTSISSGVSTNFVQLTVDY